MTQNDIIAEMKVRPTIDANAEIRHRVDFIKSSIASSGMNNLILGISGGIDSCTCGRLAQLATEELNLNGETDQTKRHFQFVAVRLPYATQADEADAQLSIEFIQPSQQITIDIQAGSDAIHQSTLAALDQAGLAGQSDSKVDFSKGNVKARMRMIAQYHLAGLLGGLVLGTDHSAENVTGFYTKHGDGACDLAPLFGLNKRQVRQLAEALGAPSKIIHKIPTADLETLSPSKPDEATLGLSYDQIDDFLEARKIDPVAEKRLIDIFLKTQHKRQPIATPSIRLED